MPRYSPFTTEGGTVALDLTPDDLATFLGTDGLNEDRAALMLELAEQACSIVVEPVPDACKGIVLGVAARAYSSPVPVGAQTVGPYAVSGVTGGLALTRAERQQLNRIAGRGGAFTIETCPDTAGQNLPWWDVSVPAGDWDQIP